MRRTDATAHPRITYRITLLTASLRFHGSGLDSATRAVGRTISTDFSATHASVRKYFENAGLSHLRSGRCSHICVRRACGYGRRIVCRTKCPARHVSRRPKVGGLSIALGVTIGGSWSLELDLAMISQYRSSTFVPNTPFSEQCAPAGT